MVFVKSQQCPHLVSSGTVSVWVFVSVLFLPRFQRQGEDWAEVTWEQMAGTGIANEEIAFGNSVKTSGTYVLYLTPALGE